MTLLDIITKASTNAEALGSQAEYSIILNPDEVFNILKTEVENPAPSSLVSPVTGWEISPTDAVIIDLSKKFFTKLKRKLKDTNSFNREEFMGMLISFLEKLREKGGISVGVDSNDNRYTAVLIDKVGFLMGRDVVGLVLEACLNLEIWELVEALIVSGLIDRSSYSSLVPKLAAKKRTDLLCLCTKHASDLGPLELLCILKYFLNPSRDAYSTMISVGKEWESQALLAIERADDEMVFGKKSRLAKDASILLMIAYDGFSNAELCLHYLLKSSNIDEVILASSIGKLNGKEMVNLIRYLGKWLKKYERFPQAIECPKASSTLGLKACDWVPKLEDVAKCLGMVLDQNFSSLVLHPELHKEIISIEEVVNSLTFEARFCSLMANVVEKLRAGAHS